MTWTKRDPEGGHLLKRQVCRIKGHDWTSGQMYSDGYTDTCDRCGATRTVDF